MSNPAAQKVVITDVWDSKGEDEIRVDHPLGSCGFPYESSSERRDQARNARDFAEKLVREGKASGVEDLIDVPTPAVDAPRG